MRSPAVGWASLLVGLALFLFNPAGGSTLGARAAALCVEHVAATDRVAQAKVVATIYRDTAAKLAEQTYSSAIEAQQHALDRVQREMVPRAAGWNVWLRALSAETRAAIGDNPDRDALVRSFNDVASGLDGAW